MVFRCCAFRRCRWLGIVCRFLTVIPRLRGLFSLCVAAPPRCWKCRYWKFVSLSSVALHVFLVAAFAGMMLRCIGVVGPRFCPPLIVCINLSGGSLGPDTELFEYSVYFVSRNEMKRIYRVAAFSFFRCSTRRCGYLWC